MRVDQQSFYLGAIWANPDLPVAEMEAAWHRFVVFQAQQQQAWREATCLWPWGRRCYHAARRWLQETWQTLRAHVAP